MKSLLRLFVSASFLLAPAPALLVAFYVAIVPGEVRAQGGPQGWFCVVSTPGQYCSGGPTGPFSGPIAGCHEIAVWAQEEAINGFACDIVKSREGFYSYKLEWHELVIQYRCGPGTTRGLYSCLTCPAGQEVQEDGTCGAPPVCSPPREMIGSNCTLPPDTPEPKKNLGEQPCSEGNPCNPATGNKYQHEVDYWGMGVYPLRLERFYNSGPVELARFAKKWRGFYDRSISFVTDGVTSKAAVKRADGKQYYFTLSGSSWVGDPDVAGRLERVNDAGGTPVGWRYTNEADEVETYDAEGKLVLLSNRASLTQTLKYSCKVASDSCPVVTSPFIAPIAGLLITVTDPVGRQLNFTYDQEARVDTITDPSGGLYIYGYTQLTTTDNLSVVRYPDVNGAVNFRQYLYGEAAHVSANPEPGVSYVNALTGKIDENGSRYATWSYDAKGRVTTSEHGVGADKVTLTYQPDGTTSVLDAMGGSRTYQFQKILGVIKSTGLTRQDSASTVLTYDPNGNAASRTDWNGNRTNYTYDLARNLETSRTEGLTSGGGTTPQTRTISTQWHATFRLTTGIAEPLRITTLVYDADGTQCGARGALCSKSIQATTDANGAQGFSATASGAPRTWTYTYNANGDVLTVNGPRTDVADITTYAYYANNDADLGKRGNVASITNAAGHVISVTAYNAHGQPLTIVDANGLTTTMTYDVRHRLKTRTAGGETITYDYDFVSQLTKVTLPDGSFLSYTYDSAHRLTGMQDNLGNRIAYTLDAMGNRTQEQVLDPANQLAQTRSRVFNNLNRLFRELGAQSQTTEYAYDNQGNVISVKDPLNRITSNQYDALNRLKQVTSPAPISAVTQFGYNGLDALTQVTDPRDLVTGYTVDGLGNLNVQTSPDTGTTTNTYDAAGNLLTQTDAKSQTTTYAYDALNRVTLITFHDGARQAYAYDQGTNGIGRLSSITETNAANQVTSVAAYAYDQHGRVVSETRTVNGIQYVLAYRYDSSGRLDQLTYPSGRTVNYAFDALGRVSGMTTNKSGDQLRTVVSDVAYHPFGGVKGYTLGNGQVYSRGIDLDGRIASYSLGAQSFAIGYDAASRISFISDVGSPANSNTYDYDGLDRVTNAVTPGTPYAYSYDAVGNRLSRTAGSATHSYAYSTTSNRIASITPSIGPVRNFTFDANGSTTADGNNTYVYDTRGRMVQAASSLGVTDYQVNALGQRIRKSNSLGDRVFHYDTRGRLIAETDPGGGTRRELIYLGDIPVGVLQ